MTGNFSGPLSCLDFSGIQVPGAPLGTSPSQPAPAVPMAGRTTASPPLGRGQGGGIDDPAHIRDLFLANPDQLALLKQNNPRLADALATGRLGKFLINK